MKHHRLIILAMMGTLALGGCRRTPPEPPGPTAEELDAQRRAEQERLAREAAERERLAREAAERERLERERAAAEATARARAIIEEMVHFDYDRFNIRQGDAEILRRKVDVLRQNPSVRVRISGHADERGSTEYNLALGMRRGTAVREFLTGHGIEAGRLEVVSFGEERPIAQGSNEAAWAQNRRAEFEVVGGSFAGGQ
jgi:peptidoglycan-associated lipoprotein